MRTAYTLIYITSLYFISTTIYTVTMPDIALYFDESTQAVQFSMTAYQMATVLSCVIMGTFSDGWGTKNSIFSGLIIFIIGCVISLFSTSLEMLMVGRFLQGFGCAAGYLLVTAAIVDLFEQKQAISIYGLSGLIASIMFCLSPLVGGILTQYLIWQFIFVVMIAYTLALLYASYYYLPAKLNKPKVAAVHYNMNDYKRLLSNRKLMTYLILMPINIGATWFLMSHIPFYFQKHLNFQSVVFGFIAAGTFISFGIMSQLGGRIAERIGVDSAINLGLYISFLGAVFLFITAFLDDTSALFISASLFINAAGAGIVLAPSLAIAMGIYRDITTKTAALRTLLSTIFSLLGSHAAEYADPSNLYHLAYFLIAVGLISIIIFHLRPKENFSKS